MACVITGGLLTKWASTPNMELLYGNLPLAEVDQIVSRLSEQSIPYELKGGSSIYVPKEKIFEVRASLAGEGLPTGGNSGFVELFDKQKNFGRSPSETAMNYNRAMEVELAKTIQLIDGIAFARVHIVRPKETVFTDGNQEASASVTLRFQPGWRVSPGTIAAVTNHVANATESLRPDNVSVMDTQGRLLTSGISSNTSVHSANNFLDIKERVENGIEQDILAFLEPALGPGRASVEVAATLDMTSQTIRTTTYDEGEPVEETINTTSMVKSGVTGPDGTSTTPGTTDKEETVENKYLVPETITTTTDVPGKITALSVSVLVDLTLPAVPVEEGAEGTSTPAPVATKIMSVTDVEELIRTAVDPKLLADAGALTVKDMPFFRPEIIVDEGLLSYEKLSSYIEIARQSSMGILAVCALLALKIFAGARKKVAAEAPAVQAGQLQSLSMLPAGQGEMGTQVVFRQQITSALQQNPEQVKQLFASWLAEDR
jgi:flagellar M-ring protein FliF